MRAFVDFVRADMLMSVRNRQALFWAFFFPVLLMCLLGVVFGQEGAFTAKLAVVDESGGAMAASLVATLEQVDALEVSEVDERTVALTRLDDGDYAAVLVVTPEVEQGFEGDTVELPFYYDDSSMVEANTVTTVVSQVVTSFANGVTGTVPLVRLDAQGVAAQGFDYIDFLVPGVIAIAIMTNGIYGVSGSYVTYRQKGVLRRLRATPLPLKSFVGASVLVHLVRALIQAALVLGVGVLLFGVTISGSGTLAKTAVLALIGAGTFVSMGFFIAAVSRNIEIAEALAQVIATPMMFLSGIFFPMDNAPAWIQPVVKALPLTYLANGLRDVIIRGDSLMAVRLDIGVLMVTTVVFLGLSIRYFRWE